MLDMPTHVAGMSNPARDGLRLDQRPSRVKNGPARKSPRPRIRAGRIGSILQAVVGPLRVFLPSFLRFDLLLLSIKVLK